MRGRFLIVSKVDRLKEYKEISEEYSVAFEINDFFVPAILDDKEKQEEIIQEYFKVGIPKGSTMHGAFFDIAIFSQDKKIREVSELRMLQSMEIARRLGVKGVVFHTNYNPYLPSQVYKDQLIATTSDYLAKLLEQFSDIEIYMENMFDTEPDILEGISKKLEGYKNYGVCLDWAHVNVYAHNKGEWIDSLKTYVKHIHINDNDFNSDLHLPVGDGKINWEQFFVYYLNYFYENRSSILIETNEPCGQRKSLEYMKKNFKLVSK